RAHDFTPLNGFVFFKSGDFDDQLWKTDGTTAGTTFLFGGVESDLAVLNGKLLFAGYDTATGTELWQSDGTVAGTALVKDIYPGSGSSYPRYLTNVNGTVYFGANDGTHAFGIWKSDGTAAGTVLVADIKPGNGDSNNLTLAGGYLFFEADDGFHGPELW